MDLKNRISEAIVILLLPALAFFMAYTAESAYAAFFNIPAGLVSIDGRNISDIIVVIILCMIIALGVESSLGQIFYFFLKDYKSQKRLSEQVKNMLFIYIFICLSIFCFVNYELKETLIPLFLLGVYIFSFITTHIKRNKEPKIDRESEIKKEIDEYEKSQKYTFLNSFLGINNKANLLLFIACLMIMYSVGQYKAKHQNTFYQINARTDIAGITIYNNRIIAKTLQNDKLADEIVIVEIENGTKLTKKLLSDFKLPLANPSPQNSIPML